MLTGLSHTRPGTRDGALRLVVVAALLFAAAVTTSIWQGLTAMNPDGDLAVGCLRLVLVCLGVLVVMRLTTPSSGVRSLSLGPVFVAAHAVLFGVTSLAWRGPQTGTASLIAVNSVIEALDVMCLAVLAFMVGYCLRPPADVVTAVRKGVSRGLGTLGAGGTGAAIIPPLAPWTLFAVGALGIALQVRTGYFGYVGDPTSQARVQSGQMLTLLVSCGLFAVLAAAYRWIASPGLATRLTLIAITMVNVAVGLFSGLKENAVLPFLAIALVVSARGGSAASIKAVSVLTVGAVVFLLVAVPLVTAYRLEVRQVGANLTPAQSLAILPRVAGQVFAGSTASEASLSLDRTSYRLRAIDSVAIVVQKSPGEVPYRSLSEVVVLPVSALVPRALWPGKPVFDIGYRFNQDYFDLPPGVNSSASVPIEADLYRRGGLLVVAAGMTLIGALCRLLDATLSPKAAPRAMFAFMGLLVLFVKDEAGVITTLASLPIYVVTGFMLSRLVFREPAPGRPAVPSAPRVARSAASG